MRARLVSASLIPRQNWRAGVALTAILCLAAAVRLLGISSEVLWLDEILSTQFLQTSSLSTYITNTQACNLPTVPLYFIVLYGWNLLYPGSVFWWRTLSILIALGAIVSTYGLGRRVSGTGAGLLAALFMACSLEHIYYSQEIRMYELMAWLAVVSVNRLLDTIASPTRWRWLAYAAAITALGWTHPYALLLIAFQGLYVLFSPNASWRTVFACGVYQVLLAASLAAYVFKNQVPDLMSAMSWLPVPSRLQAIEAIAWNATFSAAVRSVVPKMTYILVLTAGFGAFRIWRNGGFRGWPRRSVWLLCSWWLLPPALFLAYSYFIHPVFVPRYILYCSPAFFVLFSAGAMSLRPRLLRNAAVALVAAALLLSSIDRERPFRARWDLLAAEVASLGEPTVGVIWPAEHNIEIPFHLKALPVRYRPVEEQDRVADVVERNLVNGNRTWFVARSYQADSLQSEFEAAFDARGLTYCRSVFAPESGLLYYEFAPLGPPVAQIP